MSYISIKKATFINAITKYSNVLLQVVFTGVLARILTPQDYGIVAIVFVFTAFFSILSDMGIGVIVVQDKLLSESDINTVFTISFYLALILAAIFCLLSFFIAWFYKNSVYVPVCLLLSISVFFNTLNMVPNSLLMKEKRFALVGVRTLSVAVMAFVVTCFFALMGLRYYALVANSIIAAFLTFAWNYSSTKPKLVGRINTEIIARNKSYGGFQFAFNLINYFSRNLDKLLIGKKMGDISLSYYDKAYKLMLYPVQNLTFVISPVLHPILSDHQADKEYIYNIYIKIVKILSLLGCFCALFCYFAADELIGIAFGQQWKEMVPYFRILSYSLWFQIVSSSAGSIYLSIGNTKLMFNSALIHVAITVLLTVIGILSGSLMYATLCISVSYILKFFIEYFFLIKKGFGKSLVRFVCLFIPECIISLIIILSMKYAIRLLNFSLMGNFFIKFGIILSEFFILSILLNQRKWIWRK